MNKPVILFVLCMVTAFSAPLARSLEEDASPPPEKPALKAAPRPDAWWTGRHAEKVELARQGDVDLVFIGDSITHGFEGAGRKVWEEYYEKRRALNLGFSGDCTEHVIWRLQNGEIEGIAPKLVVLMIGTNNTGQRMDEAARTAEGIEAILDELGRRLPRAKVLLLAVFPRSAQPEDPLRRRNDELNRLLPGLADDRRVFFRDINKAFLDEKGMLSEEIMPDLLHPEEKGYRIWAEAMEPALVRLLGEKKSGESDPE